MRNRLLAVFGAVGTILVLTSGCGSTTATTSSALVGNRVPGTGTNWKIIGPSAAVGRRVVQILAQSNSATTKAITDAITKHQAGNPYTEIAAAYRNAAHQLQVLSYPTGRADAGWRKPS